MTNVNNGSTPVDPFASMITSSRRAKPAPAAAPPPPDFTRMTTAHPAAAEPAATSQADLPAADSSPGPPVGSPSPPADPLRPPAADPGEPVDDSPANRPSRPARKPPRLFRRSPRPARSGDGRAEQRSKVAAARAQKAQTKAAAKTARIGFAAAAGARKYQLVIRWAVGMLVLLLLVAGIRQLLRPTPTPPVDTTVVAAQAVSAQLRGTGFPSEAAQAFAVRFARVYYSWSESKQTDRAADLAPYLSDSIQDGWDGHGSQTVTAGPYVAAATTSTDAHHGIVTLALQLGSGNWIYPQIPVYAAADAFTVAGQPALGPPPGRAAFPGTPDVLGDHDDAAVPAVSTVLSGFFTAWGAGDQDQLARYLTVDATAAARSGLAGTVTFRTISNVAIAAAGGPTRTALATVTWTTGPAEQPGSAGMQQTYQLTIVAKDGLWSVKDIRVGIPALEPADSNQSVTSSPDVPAALVPAPRPAPPRTSAAATPTPSTAAPPKPAASTAPATQPRRPAPSSSAATAPHPSAPPVASRPGAPRSTSVTPRPTSPPTATASR